MKSLLRHMLPIVGSMCICACTPALPQPYDLEMSVVIDQTDPLPVFPTAESLTAPLGISDSLDKSCRIVLSTINDKDIPTTYLFTLERTSPWNSNSVIRKAQVQRLKRKIAACLEQLRHTATCPRSIIYRSIARQCNRLAETRAQCKMLCVYSNLTENADLNFYDPKTVELLHAQPRRMEQQLTQNEPLGNLNGIGVWLIYEPADYRENAHYMTIANFYWHMLQRHGATVHLGNKLLVL